MAKEPTTSFPFTVNKNTEWDRPYKPQANPENNRLSQLIPNESQRRGSTKKSVPPLNKPLPRDAPKDSYSSASAVPTIPTTPIGSMQHEKIDYMAFLAKLRDVKTRPNNRHLFISYYTLFVKPLFEISQRNPKTSSPQALLKDVMATFGMDKTESTKLLETLDRWLYSANNIPKNSSSVLFGSIQKLIQISGDTHPPPSYDMYPPSYAQRSYEPTLLSNLPPNIPEALKQTQKSYSPDSYGRGNPFESNKKGYPMQRDPRYPVPFPYDKDPYYYYRGYDDPRFDPRFDPMFDPRDPRFDPRFDPRDPRLDPRFDPRMDSRYMDPRIDPRMDPRIDPRMDPRLDPRFDPRYDSRFESRMDPRDSRIDPRDPRIDPRDSRIDPREPRDSRDVKSESRIDPRIDPRMDPRHPYDRMERDIERMEGRDQRPSADRTPGERRERSLMDRRPLERGVVIDGPSDHPNLDRSAIDSRTKRVIEHPHDIDPRDRLPFDRERDLRDPRMLDQRELRDSRIPGDRDHLSDRDRLPLDSRERGVDQRKRNFIPPYDGKN
ncbi:hypothetical protein QTN25_001900 [Entamoeba marina]